MPDKKIAQQEVEGFNKDKVHYCSPLGFLRFSDTNNHSRRASQLLSRQTLMDPTNSRRSLSDTPKSRGILSARLLSDWAFSTATTRKPG